MPDTPEQIARQQIDAQLAACGWVVQDYKSVDFSAGRGIALREVPLTTGPCDYLLLVDRKSLGVVEAKGNAEQLTCLRGRRMKLGGWRFFFVRGVGTVRMAREAPLGLGSTGRFLRPFFRLCCLGHPAQSAAARVNCRRTR